MNQKHSKAKHIWKSRILIFINWKKKSKSAHIHRICQFWCWSQMTKHPPILSTFSHHSPHKFQPFSHTHRRLLWGFGKNWKGKRRLLNCSSVAQLKNLRVYPTPSPGPQHTLPISSPHPPSLRRQGLPAPGVLVTAPPLHPRFLLSAGSPVPTRRAYSSFLLILSTTSGHGSGEQEWGWRQWL